MPFQLDLGSATEGAQPLDLAQEFGDGVRPRPRQGSGRWVYRRALGPQKGAGSGLVWLAGTNPESKVETIVDAWV